MNLDNHGHGEQLSSLERVKQFFQSKFGQTTDLAVVSISIGSYEGLLCYLTTMTSSDFIKKQVLKELASPEVSSPPTKEAVFQQLGNNHFAGLTHEVVTDLEQLPPKIVLGYGIILIEGVPMALAVDVRSLNSRSIEEPTTQNVVRGPKEGFTESADTNMSLIRRRFNNVNLRFEKFELGYMTHTAVYIAYLDGEVDTEIVDQVREKLKQSHIDSLFDSGRIEELLHSKGKGMQLFPTVYNSERPDAVCRHMTNKRIAIIVDGSPFVLVVPSIFTDFFKSPEDEYQWFVIGSFSRYLRYFAFILSLTVPALYIAVTSYHQELIPSILLTSIAAQREGIPFPASIEILLMEITFEILREAGTRMPRIVGATISIVGALVLGEAAVQAGVVSNITVIVVSLTAISGFVAPIYTFGSKVRFFRFGMIVLSSVIGLYGLVLGCCLLMIQLTRIESFGVPYLSLFSKWDKRSVT
ncbi:spore germination protein [Paenibacillus glycanilyticus]|uniref:Spore germination protein KA n=1 Tax=Paenibacillus glycanilyticus TaxID=126569 RepID=A0ABQ6GCX4_9BACL|nr:spore germination protein [Paenibacillus glycanilyticus]GLX67930.1 spore germination protein KA [Paenibacillus glycanilyticus]